MFKSKGLKWFARLYLVRCHSWDSYDGGESSRILQNLEETIFKETYEFLHPELLTFDKVFLFSLSALPLALSFSPLSLFSLSSLSLSSLSLSPLSLFSLFLSLSLSLPPSLPRSRFLPLHSTLTSKIIPQEWLAEDWQNLQREGPLSFSSALFSKEFCDLLTEEVLNIKRQCRLVKLVLFIPFLLLPLILILLNNNTDNDGSVS